jgi:TolB protein
MKRTLIGSLLLGSLLLVGAWWAGSPVAHADPMKFVEEVDVGGNARLLRVAIPADGKIGDVLRKNAAISGGFEVIDRKSIPASLIRAGSFDAKAWSDIGADAVILADDAGGQTRIRLHLLSEGNSPKISKGYPASDPVKAANRFMNEVVDDFTGQPGVFGSRIAYVRTARNPTVSKNVQTVEMNGENPSSVTSNRSLNILPSIGPGGQVLYTSYAKRNPDLWMGAGAGAVRVSKFPGLNLGGAMSPDGSTIALALSKDGNSEIYSIDTSGNIKARLTNNAAIDGSPSFGQGGQVAFVSSRAGGPQVFRMTASGGSAARVTKQGTYNTSPDWCQAQTCGNWIVYAGRDASNRFDIFKIDAKSGKIVRITQNPGRNLDPSFSPDGRHIAFSRDGGLFVSNDQGNNQIEIARGASTPDWGPRAGGY